MTTFSCPVAEHLTLGCLRPLLISDSCPLTYTAPSFSKTSNLFNGSGAGASSTSPVAVLKQAGGRQRGKTYLCTSHLPPCHGHVSRPSGASIPFFSGAPKWVQLAFNALISFWPCTLTNTTFPPSIPSTSHSIFSPSFRSRLLWPLSLNSVAMMKGVRENGLDCASKELKRGVHLGVKKRTAGRERAFENMKWRYRVQESQQAPNTASRQQGM
jgi:hypothetical protein